MLAKLGDFWGKLKPQYDDDVIDRLNYIYTNFIILAFAITIAAKQFVGEPLQCWVPAQFKGGWEQYVENYCFVENTYWLSMDDAIPHVHQHREDRELQYYQWVPFVLALQALLFYLPRIVWNMLNFHTGLNITALIQTAMITKKDGDKKILKGIDIEASNIADHFRAAVDYGRDGANRGNAISRAMSKGWGVYVTILYLVVKLLFIVNVILQFVILNHFLGPQYSWWGYDILRDLANGREWEQSGHFPRVSFTLCLPRAYPASCPQILPDCGKQS
uniref:Innexin n=1 Tax=Plectus sambesii TaxID=2011161 RepID=A0A914WHM2_9BILA